MRQEQTQILLNELAMSEGKVSHNIDINCYFKNISSPTLQVQLLHKLVPHTVNPTVMKIQYLYIN
uniref:Uncharacterized protein n=1 Tax=Anguilla anguilla TaxID=7936 RepID=A0A0E9R958_ANGAN